MFHPKHTTTYPRGDLGLQPKAHLLRPGLSFEAQVPLYNSGC